MLSQNLIDLYLIGLPQMIEKFGTIRWMILNANLITKFILGSLKGEIRYQNSTNSCIDQFVIAIRQSITISFWRLFLLLQVQVIYDIP